jgi:hypothetical protein
MGISEKVFTLNYTRNGFINAFGAQKWRQKTKREKKACGEKKGEQSSSGL